MCPDTAAFHRQEQQVALVTGAAHGLGREVARQLAEAGRHVVITARDPGQAAATAAELGAGVTALAVGLDVVDPASVTAAAQALASAPGRLDVLVNNSAAFVDWSETGSGADLDAAHQVMEVNLFGAWRLTQALRRCCAEAPPRGSSTSAAAGAATVTRPSG